jgi:acyl carrier protein
MDNVMAVQARSAPPAQEDFGTADNLIDQAFGIVDAILGTARELLARPALAPDDDFFDHGATSLSFVRILAEINRRYGVVILPAELTDVTARGLGAYVTTAAAATEKGHEK